MRSDRGSVNLHPPQRSVLDDHKKQATGTFTSLQRQPSAGRKPPPGKPLLPEFPRRDEVAGYRQTSVATASGGSSYATGSGPGNACSTDHSRPAAATSTGAYAGSSSAGGRSTSVPRPSSRTIASQPTAGTAGTGSHGGISSGTGVAGASSGAGPHPSPRGATRAPVTPVSILDSLKTPSVLSGGSIASLAQRMNSSSGWDYSSLAGGSSVSSLRLKRQAGLASDPATAASGGGGSIPGSPVTLASQYHSGALPPAGPDQLRAVYLSGGSAGSVGGGGGVPGTPGVAGPGRRSSTDRVMSRNSSFSSGLGGGPSAPPLPAGPGAGAAVSAAAYAVEQQSGQVQSQRLAPGAVYAAQYAHQYGNAASTVYIPYSSQHGGTASAPSAQPASYIGRSGSAGGSVPQVGSPAVGYAQYLGGTGVGGAVPQPRTSLNNMGTGTQLPPFSAGPGSPAAAAGTVPSAPPLVPSGSASGAAAAHLYHHHPSASASPYSATPSDYAASRGAGLQRGSSLSSSASAAGAAASSSTSRTAGGSAAAGASAPPLPLATGAAASAGGVASRLRSLSVAVEEDGGDGGGASSSGLRRLPHEDSQPRRSGTGAVGSPSGVSGGSGGTALSSPKTASSTLQPSAPPLPPPDSSQQQAHQQHYSYASHPSQYGSQQQQQQHGHHASQAQAPQHPHQHQQPYGGMSASAAVEPGSGSYTSTASSTANSAKSSVAVAGSLTAPSSTSTSRTTSSISQRSSADAAQPPPPPPPPHPPHRHHPQAQGAGGGAAAATATGRSAAASAAATAAASARALPSSHASSCAAGSSSSSSSSSSGSSQDSSGDLRASSSSEALPPPHGSSAGGGGTGSSQGPSVCGPLPDLPVVVAPRDLQSGRGCVGLQNLGNTCFMNSILQSLNAVPELVQQFLSPAERNWSSKAVVAPAYSGLVRDMMSGCVGGSVNPSAFLRKVSKHDSRWGDGRQQDSQEFLNSLLEVLQSECNRITSKPVYRELAGKGPEEAQALEAFQYARSWNDSLVDDIFGGFTQSTIQCHACNRLSHTFEPFLGLAVPIPTPPGGSGDRSDPRDGNASVSVADCLRAFVECEELQGDDSYKCEACKRRQPHSKRLQVFRPPRVLVLTLKRFAQRPAAPGFFSRFRSPAKNNTPVRLDPEPLDLAPYCNPLGLRGLSVRGRGSVTPLYHLVAVSHHSGSLEGGHYTAQARSCLDGLWYNFNDSSVRREHGRPSGASSSAYVLFYRLAALPSSSSL